MNKHQLVGLTIDTFEYKFDHWGNGEIHIKMTNGVTVVFHTIGYAEEKKIGVQHVVYEAGQEPSRP